MIMNYKLFYKDRFIEKYVDTYNSLIIKHHINALRMFF
jgi:hypothetical protein